MAVFQKLLRVGEGKKIRALESLVPEINAVESEYEALSDEALRAKTGDFKLQIERGAELNDLLIDAFAVTREAARRVLGQRHYDVQLVGGAALHFGWVAEMRTGEGKTLVSTLPVYLNALSGQGVHIVTVNNYLATRDADWMGRVHRFLGLEVGLVVSGQTDSEFKRIQYSADITYGTNNEFGFDYLRDNMAPSLSQQVQRGHSYCIVDEVDSILIDEARTPLIISGRLGDAAKLYGEFAQIARTMTRDLDYEVEEDKRNVAVLEPGIEKVERALDVDNLYDQVSSNFVHQMSAALKAKELYRRDRDYVVQSGEVKIVDEFTGRILEGRRWSEGLHQAVEAKEGVNVKAENQTLATITLQNYFRLYEKLAGMTGTATTEAAELGNTYGLDVVPIPTHRPVQRADHADLIYKTETAKIEAVVDDIEQRRVTGQPILVGTVSVENSEKISRALDQRGITHNVLNAKEHQREAEIITQAGRLGGVTVATNMAGRGVDIVLGGNPEGLALQDLYRDGVDPGDPLQSEALSARVAYHEPNCSAEGAKVRAAGGLYVLGTERHESRRIDNQLRGRSGRQGDPGESRFYLSLEDDLMRIFATGAMNWVMDRALPDDSPIEANMVTKAIERAQNTVEQKNAEVRKNVLKYDEVMNEQRKVIYARRAQILDGEDLREESLGYVEAAIAHIVDQFCVEESPSEWDLEALHAETSGYWPTELDLDEMAKIKDAVTLEQVMVDDATRYFELREAELGASTMREVERQVLLRIVDQRWREHLYEMDYLREGIHLRGIGQKDPVSEWQREGFDMFSSMLESVYRDFVKYAMHAEVITAEQQNNRLDRVRYSSSESPAELASAGAPPKPSPAVPTAKQTQVVKTDEEKIGRNDPCHCGSGKKFKHCHGR
jgi:preprotein translocase subunit SecA